LVEYVNHECKPPRQGTFEFLEKIGRDAIKEEIAKMSDEDLAKIISVMTYASGGPVDRLLVKELAQRFRKLAGVDDEG
jgi:hypothetical protein